MHRLYPEPGDRKEMREMQCPKCRCEVGKQHVCPYCGTVLEDNRIREESEQTTISRIGKLLRGVDSRVHSIEDSIKILLAMQTGTFIVVLLLLIAVCVK